jgi:hypothetical protein
MELAPPSRWLYLLAFDSHDLRSVRLAEIAGPTPLYSADGSNSRIPILRNGLPIQERMSPPDYQSYVWGSKAASAIWFDIIATHQIITRTGTSAAGSELPFVIGVLADFSGIPEKPLVRVGKRRFVDLNLGDLDDILKACHPRLSFNVRNT